MDEKKIARINELARKAKAEGLTDAEIEERAALRQEYLNAVMANARSVLENTYIVDEKGNKRKLRGREKGKHELRIRREQRSSAEAAEKEQ